MFKNNKKLRERFDIFLIERRDCITRFDANKLFYIKVNL